MLDFSLFAAVYRRLAARRRLLFGATLVLLALSIWGFSRIEMQENVAALLPDDGSVSARDFELLQQAPLSRKLVLTVTAPPGTDSAQLVTVVDRLAAELDPALFSRVVTGPAGPGQSQLLPLLLDNLPNLLGPADLARLAEFTAPPELTRRLEASYARLFGPEGWLLKDLLRRDPLGLRELALAKFQTLNLIPNAQLTDNHFLSNDGQSALLLADTPVAITDVAGALAMEQAFATARAAVLPEGWQAGLLSGHRYTLANATAIKQDLWLILSCASLAILALFLIFLRSWRALFVFSLPLAVLSLAAVAVATIYRPVSAITIGFGAVLLGIAVDFALHVYFALRAAPDDPAGELSRVARPILFGGLTTLGAFAVLLLSDLPGQRQLAVFALAGLGAALLMSLLVLPQLVPLDGSGAGSMRMAVPRIRRRSRWVLAVWLLLLGLAGWQALGLRFNGELRALSLVPDELVAAEQVVRERWGGMRSQAMVFTEGADLAQALERNAALLNWLQRQRPDDPLVSLAGILPGPAQQAANRLSWQAFWEGPQGRQALATLRAEGARLGFASDAFAPFERLCRELPPPLEVADWRRAGLGPLFDLLLLPEGETLRLITLVPDTEEIAALFDGSPPDGVQLVSQTRFGQRVSQAIRHDFVTFIVLASLVILALLALLFRRPLPMLQALVPVASGLLVMFGAMGWLGLEFNLFNVVATILVIGLGVDYGIFMVCRQQERPDPVTAHAVLVSGLTTLAGFGALVLARHPAMHSLGVTVLLGIGAAIPAALWVVPALNPGRAR